MAGYRFLNTQDGKISNLGPAFFTKWLYFVTADGSVDGGPQAAPILDVLVLNWLRTKADLRLRTGWTVDYETYLDLLTTWGKPYGIHRAGVEERIFRLIREDGVADSDATTT